MKSHPGRPLGDAEQYLLTLSSIPELEARLKLWDFKLSFAGAEDDIAEDLMDMKECISELKTSKTLEWVMATLLAITNFVNGAKVVGAVGPLVRGKKAINLGGWFRS